MSFAGSIDIANRACQHVGVTRIDTALGFTENSKQASEIAFCYDKLRRAELRRNVWRFAIRKAVLRPIDTTTRLLAAAMWVSSTTYFVGSIVSDETGQAWISLAPNNLGNPPQQSLLWSQYFGPLTVSLYDSTIAYSSGELVYTAAGDGTSRIYLSLVDGNADVPSAATAYGPTVTYTPNQVVTYLGVPYMSLLDLNIGQQPNISPLAWTTVFVGGTGSIKWLQIGGVEFPNGVALSGLNIVYPIGSGPSSQATTRNVFRLPASYLRKVTQDPKASPVSWLGAPNSPSYDDWDFQGNYLVSSQADLIIFRFVADTVDVTSMDDMFCEGLACRIAIEVCEALTQSSEKLKTIAGAYQKFMTEARLVNGIETGWEDPPLDDYLAVRL